MTTFSRTTCAHFQAKLTNDEHAGEHAMFIADLPTEGVRVVRTPVCTPTVGHRVLVTAGHPQTLDPLARRSIFWRATTASSVPAGSCKGAAVHESATNMRPCQPAEASSVRPNSPGSASVV